MPPGAAPAARAIIHKFVMNSGTWWQRHGNTARTEAPADSRVSCTEGAPMGYTPSPSSAQKEPRTSPGAEFEEERASIPQAERKKAGLVPPASLTSTCVGREVNGWRPGSCSSPRLTRARTGRSSRRASGLREAVRIAFGDFGSQSRGEQAGSSNSVRYIRVIGCE
jgi:hypothetical protein